MFKHIFVTRIKVLLREKTLVFWTLIFPIVLSLFFQMAFSNLNGIDKLEIIPIAVVENEAFAKEITLPQVLASLAQKGDQQLLTITYTTKEEASKLLTEEKIDAYVTVSEDGINMSVAKSGMNQTIVKTVLDEYQQKASVIKKIIENDPSLLESGLLNQFQTTVDYIEEVQPSNTDSTVIYFYSLIGMFCLYGGFWGIKTVNETEANMSMHGARVSVSPVHKFKLLISSLIAALTIQCIEMIIVIGFLRFVLGVDFGSNTLLILLISFVGCFTGISLGTLIGAAIKKSENFKVGILLSITMSFSFLSGMMMGDIKYLVQENVPLLAMINPVNLITDGLYSLYYYTTYTRYFTNILFLIIIAASFCIGAYLLIRRKNYDSI